jgi:uncharacterized membrane protein
MMIRQLATMASKNRVKLLIILGALLVTGIFCSVNDRFYTYPIGTIEQVKTVSQEDVVDEFGNEDVQVTQNLDVKISQTGKRTTITNRYLASQVLSEKYHKGQKLILSDDYNILSLKRDRFLALFVVALLGIFGLFTTHRFSYLLIGLIINALIFVIFVVLDVKRLMAPVELALLLGGISTLLTLYVAIHDKRQTLVAFGSTIIASGLSILIGHLVLTATNNQGVHFELADFITQNPEVLFLAQSFLSILGAVMDLATDISAAVFSLNRQSDDKSKLFKHGLTAGREIMGALVNVLFMVFMAELIPMCLIYLHNGDTLPFIFDQVLNLGILQTLITGIGIVLAVPIVAFISAKSLEAVHE